jgi:hypothetical protein
MIGGNRAFSPPAPTPIGLWGFIPIQTNFVGHQEDYTAR